MHLFLSLLHCTSQTRLSVRGALSRHGSQLDSSRLKEEPRWAYASTYRRQKSLLLRCFRCNSEGSPVHESRRREGWERRGTRHAGGKGKEEEREQIGGSIWILPFNTHPRPLARFITASRALAPAKNFNRKIMSHLIARTWFTVDWRPDF